MGLREPLNDIHDFGELASFYRTWLACHAGPCGV
jgi:hypothetical protein